jgi:hypothetical protein
MQTGEPMMSTPDAAADAAPEATCDDQSFAIAQKVIDAINTAQVTNRCTMPADCFTMQPLHNRCYDGCTLPISSNGATAIEVALRALERNTCPSFIQSGCTVNPPTCPPPPPVACQDGRCVVPSPSAVQSCGDLSRSVSDRVAQAAAVADRHCLAHTDCTVMIPGNPCFSNCEGELTLSLTGAASVQKAIDAATVEICPGFFAAGCELASAVCDPPKMRARCVDNTCKPISTL